jgi:carboxymethylenebutenolidase
MKQKKSSDFSQDLLDLYDAYAHGIIDRRTFLQRASKFAAGGLGAVALLNLLSPQYSFAAQVAETDPRIFAERVDYQSPDGHGAMQGLMVRPTGATQALAGVLVVHENRGLNPYIEDVARRLAVAGFLAFAPDALYPLGGYPRDDDAGRELQRQLDRDKITEDFVAAARLLHAHPDSSGRTGVVGFCFGGLMSNTLAWRLPEIISAAVPYYGGQPTEEQAALIKGALLLHFAGLDTRVNAGWSAYEAALKSAGVDYTAYVYPDMNHGFHNNTTPRYDEAAAKLSWARTIDFFNQKLK